MYIGVGGGARNSWESPHLRVINLERPIEPGEQVVSVDETEPVEQLPVDLVEKTRGRPKRGLEPVDTNSEDFTARPE